MTKEQYEKLKEYIEWSSEYNNYKHDERERIEDVDAAKLTSDRLDQIEKELDKLMGFEE